jgi:hypothetical protein
MYFYVPHPGGEGATTRGTQASHLMGSSLFALCPCISLPHVLSSCAFPGQDFFLKKLDSIFCPQCRDTNADTLKRQRPIEEGDQELEKRLVQEELL